MRMLQYGGHPAGGGRADTPAGGGQAEPPAGAAVLMDTRACAMVDVGKEWTEGVPMGRQGCMNINQKDRRCNSVKAARPPLLKPHGFVKAARLC